MQATHGTLHMVQVMDGEVTGNELVATIPKDSNPMVPGNYIPDLAGPILDRLGWYFECLEAFDPVEYNRLVANEFDHEVEVVVAYQPKPGTFEGSVTRQIWVLSPA